MGGEEDQIWLILSLSKRSNKAIPPESKLRKQKILSTFTITGCFNSEHLAVNPLLQSDFHLDDRIRDWLIERIPLDMKGISQNRNLSDKSVNRLKQVQLDLERSHSRLAQIKLDLGKSKLR